jgi:hypothetical protein
MKELRNPIALLVLVIVVATFSAPFGTPALATFAKDFLPAVATLVAAYAGAWYGSKLKRDAVAQERRGREMAAGARALFTMWRQLNEVALIQELVIEKYRNYPPAPLAMPPIDFLASEIIRLDIDSLSFLIDSGKPELLADLCIAETRYMHALDVIRRRSNLHANEVQPKIENKIPKGRNLKPAELRKLVGPRLFSQLVGLTSEVIAKTDDAVKTLEAVSADLHTTMKEIFPDGKFPRPGPMDEEGLKTMRTAQPIE